MAKKRNTHALTIGLLFLVLIGLPLTIYIGEKHSEQSSHAAGNELFVSAGGSGDCSQAAPCSFSQADSKATPGTTIHVAPGDYGNVKIATNGNATSHIRWLSDTKWGAKMSGDVNTIVDLPAQYVDFEGFDVTGGANAQDLIHLGAHSRAIGNHVHDSPRGCQSNGGITTGGNTEVIGNLIENIGSGTPGGCNLFHGIYANTNDIIQNNIIINTPNGSGIHAWHDTTHMTVVNNTVIGAGADGILIGSDTGSNTGGYIANNISVNNNRNGLSETGTAQGNTFVNNLTFNNKAGRESFSNNTKSSGGIDADPLFVNQAGNDYHLQQGSPAIDKGTSNQAPANDYDGKPRPQGAGIDIGAMEFGDATGTSSSASSSSTNYVCAGSTTGSVCPSNSPIPGGSSSSSSDTSQISPTGSTTDTSTNPITKGGGGSIIQLFLGFFVSLFALLASFFGK